MGRCLRYCRVHTTDHTCESDSSVVICDDHIFRSELILDSIESEEFFSLFCEPYSDRTRYLVSVEYMHRLTELSEYEIGDIDEIHLGCESCTFHHE